MSDTRSGFRFVTAIVFLATAGLVAGCVDDDSGRRVSTTERTTTTVAPAPAYVTPPAPAPGSSSSTTTTTTTKQTYP
jgi:hypothetical protein